MPPEDAPRLLVARGAVIGPGRVISPARLVYVRPAAYAGLRQADRHAVARLVGRINHASPGRSLLLLGPGRWGSRDASLGIPVVFAEINHVAALGEIVAMHAQLIPDVSLGTHFLNELIEADVLYFALFPRLEGNVIDEAAILLLPNRLAELLPDAGQWRETVHVADFAPGTLRLHADAEGQRVVVTAAPG